MPDSTDPLSERDPSIETAADLLDVSKKTIRRIIANGDVDAYKLGGLVKIRRSSLARYVIRCRAIPVKLAPDPAPKPKRPVGRPKKIEAAASAEG
jgi:excisionase family DNA binding protein